MHLHRGDAITGAVAVRALLYDVHGNLPALRAVLDDAARHGAERFLLGGDYALFGPWPAETVATLRELPNATWIRGNVDRWTAFPDHVEGDEGLALAVAACREALGRDVADELGRLPERASLDGALYCHASPRSDMKSFLPEASPGEDELLAGVVERRVVFGHTHVQFRRGRADGVELVNPGSVGLPLDGDTRAAYALVDDGGRLEHCRVKYDNEGSAAAVRKLFGDADWVLRSERRLRSAAA
jgi:predicted phosphodiesterase